MSIQSRVNAICVAGFLSLLVGSELHSEPWPGKIGLPEFPKDNPARAFAEMKIYDATGSPIRRPIEDWTEAVKRVGDDSEWKRWIEFRRKAVDSWMARRQDKVGWIAGWHHDFVSPKDGSFLTFTPDEPGPKSLSSPSDPEVKLTPKLHAAWVYQFRMRHSDMMVEAARLFRITGETNYAKWAAGQLDFYTDNYDRWPTQNGAHFMFQSLDEAVILTRWITVTRTLDGFVTAQQRERWSVKLFKPQAQLLGTTLRTIHNIACWQRSAAAQAALYCRDAEIWQAAVEGPFGVRDQVRRGITSDYLWYEQSLGYNGYVVKALAPFFQYALSEGKGAGLESEMATVENLMLAPLLMRFPNGQLPNPADAGKPLRLSAALLEGALDRSTGDASHPLATFWRLYPTKPGVKMLQTRAERSWDILLDPPPLDPIAANLPAVVSHNLESSRMAILRSGSWQVYFHYGQLASTHSQAEALNFEACYRGVGLSHDPGTTGYGSKFTTEFFRSGVCHNVPLVDGVGQSGWHPGELESFSATNVVASQPAYRPNASARRTVAIAGEELRDEVSIVTTDDKAHMLGFVLNLQGKVQLAGDFKEDRGFAKAHPAVAFKYWQDVNSMNATNQASLEVEFEGAVIQLEFRLPGRFTLFHALAPDCPPKQREVLYVETWGAEATLKTVFSGCIMDGTKR